MEVNNIAGTCDSFEFDLPLHRLLADVSKLRHVAMIFLIEYLPIYAKPDVLIHAGLIATTATPKGLSSFLKLSVTASIAYLHA
jgi:hypothetical protein